MRLLDEAVRALMDDLHERVQEETLEARLAAATGPCALEHGGRERHIELVRDIVESAQRRNARGPA